MLLKLFTSQCQVRFSTVQCTTVKTKCKLHSIFFVKRLTRRWKIHFCHLKKSQRALGSSARPSPRAQHQNLRFKLGPFFLTVLNTQDSLCPLQSGATGGAFITFFHAEAAFKRRSSNSILASVIIIVVLVLSVVTTSCSVRSTFSSLLIPGLPK